MPGVTFEDVLSGSGAAELGGTRVYYVAWEVTVAAPYVRHPSPWDDQVVIGVGHFELGNDLTPAGLISGIGYGAQHWMGSMVGQWIVSPAVAGGAFTAEIAEWLRWTISPGTEVHLYVFGDA